MSLGSDAPAANLLPRVTTDDAVARLEGLLSEMACAPSETLLAFDADGTLWSGDVGIDNFEALLEAGAVLPAAASALREEATACGLPLADDPTAQGAGELIESFDRAKERFAGQVFREKRTFERAYLIDLFQDMIEKGSTFHRVDTHGGYMEIDTLQDESMASAWWHGNE